jgi:hypothetical protein
MDGGELTNMVRYFLYYLDFYNLLNYGIFWLFKSGEFNGLYAVDKEQWDMMEQMIRSSNKKPSKLW